MIICTGRGKRYLYWIRQMSAREERHCEMMMAQDDAAQTSPDRPLLCVRMCVAFRARDRVFPRAKYITWDIYSREKFFQLRVTSRPEKRRSRPRSRSRQSSTYPRRIHIRDPPFSHLRVSRKGWNGLPPTLPRLVSQNYRAMNFSFFFLR